jgi:peptide-methionine (R)-S-oxide reductase
MNDHDDRIAKLTPEQFQVTQNCGTEPPFSGKYYKHNEKGIYACVVCNNQLFSSETKYDSGSGWPSFYDAIDSAKIKTIEDTTLGMTRVEIRCGSCDAHLGHVFSDGPPKTGRRYCVNSLSLDFKGDQK